MKITRVMGQPYTSLGKVVGSMNGSYRPLAFELLIEQAKGKPLAAFALTTTACVAEESNRTVQVPRLIPADAVLMRPQHTFRPAVGHHYQLTLEQLVGMVEHRIYLPHFWQEPLPQAIDRTVTPLFRAGVVDLDYFVWSAQHPPTLLTKQLPSLRDFAAQARLQGDAWQEVTNTGGMLVELTEALYFALLVPWFERG